METQTILLIGVVVMLIAITISLLLLLSYAGAFTGVDLRKGQPPLGAIKIVYKYCCDYAINVDEMYRSLIEKFPNRQLVTLYYDNPAEFSSQLEAKLRFCIGLVLHGENAKEATDSSNSGGSISDSEDAIVAKLAEEGFKVKQLPSVTNSVHCQYPFTCAASVGYAERRVLPAIADLFKQQSVAASPIIEVCDPSTSVIQFIVPLERSEDFVVPELDKQPAIPADPYAAAYANQTELMKKSN